ncbi:MAG: IS3 family transposase [Syntrophales bacterium]
MERIPNGRYTREFREEAVKMVAEGSLSSLEVSRRLSLPKSTLERWIRVSKKGALGQIGKGQRPLTELEQELARVKRELSLAKMERDILKKAAGVLCQRVAARYAVIKELRLIYPVLLLCRVLEVTKSGYYAWIRRPLSIRQKEEERLALEIRAAHNRTRQTDGPERLQRDLADNGIIVGVHRIKRIRKELGLRCCQKRRFKATTNSRHSLPVAENLLRQNFHTAAPNQVWLTDITYISTEEGWLYLAGHKDLFTGGIVGYAMAERMTKNLVIQSFLKALATKGPTTGLIHHSDRGSQYCAGEYASLLNRYGMRASMSRKGNCYDNAPMESFWGVLKNELIHHCRYATRQEAIRDITEYIEIFYNRQRKQARLGFLSPAAFERWFYEKQMAA